MKYIYFIGCQSIEEVKTKYKQLVKTHHPDTQTGSHDKFVVLKQEFDHILEGRAIFPIKNIDVRQYPVTPDEAYEKVMTETVVNLSPEEIQKQRATTFYNNLRQGDIIFDQIDAIVQEAKEERNSPLWIYQEVQKLDDLTIDHFKYLTFVLNHPVSNAQVFFKKYRLTKVV